MSTAGIPNGTLERHPLDGQKEVSYHEKVILDFNYSNGKEFAANI